MPGRAVSEIVGSLRESLRDDSSFGTIIIKFSDPRS